MRIQNQNGYHENKDRRRLRVTFTFVYFDVRLLCGFSQSLKTKKSQQHSVTGKARTTWNWHRKCGKTPGEEKEDTFISLGRLLQFFLNKN